MDFHHLQTVITLAEEKSFTRAARRLYVSQPSLSQLVKRIEVEVGAVIFDRATQPLGLTVEGRIFVSRARRLLDDYSTTLADMRRARDIDQVTMGATPMIGSILIPDLIGRVRRSELPFTLNPVESSSLELDELIERGVLDFAVISQRLVSSSLHFEPVLWNSFFVASKIGSAIRPENETTISATAVFDQPLLLPKSGSVRSALDGFFTSLGVKPEVSYESRSTDTILGLVEAGLGVAMIPECFITDHLSERHPRVVFSSMDPCPPKISLGIVSRRSDDIPQSLAMAMAMTKDSLRRLFGSPFYE